MEKSDQKYSNKAGGYYELPRCEWLLKAVKQIEANLIAWYKKNKYNQGDSYSCAIGKNGKWIVSHSNDYPMQHGDGDRHVFSESDFADAQKINSEIY